MHCCPDDYECRPNHSCCPDTAETCGGEFCVEAGSVCCSDYVCPAGTTCNEHGSQNCCKETETSCEGVCKFSASSYIGGKTKLAGCPEGSECGPEAGYRRWTTTSTMTAAGTSLATSTSTTIVDLRPLPPPSSLSLSNNPIFGSASTNQLGIGFIQLVVISLGSSLMLVI